MDRLLLALLLGCACVSETEAEAPVPAVVEFSARKIYQQAGPAVVLLICGGKDGGQGELGTGSVIDEGRVLTNAHVVIKASTGRPHETIKVYLKPARVTGDAKVDLVRPHLARVLKHDRDLDLALLEVENLPRLTPVALGDSERIEPGEPVAAIGHPEQGGLWTLTTGVVSTVLSDLGGVKGKNVFQTDASINRGNSGGPLLDRSGAQIGVNTSMARKAPDGLTITSVNFSVRSNVVRKWLGESDVALARAPAAAEWEPEPPVSEPKPPASKPEKPAAPEPKPTEPAPAPRAEPDIPAKPSAPVIAQKPTIVTPPKPYKIEDLIEKEMAEMEDLEAEMRREIESRR